jgi:hypothetical protein
LFRQGNTCGLALLDVLQLDLGNGKKHTRDKMSYSAAQVGLLRDGNDAHGMTARAGLGGADIPRP